MRYDVGRRSKHLFKRSAHSAVPQSVQMTRFLASQTLRIRGLEGSWWLLRELLGCPGQSWSVSGASKAYFERVLERQCASWRLLGASWGGLGAVFGIPGGVLGASWEHFRRISWPLRRYVKISKKPVKTIIFH